MADAGLFGPGSVTWKVHAHPAMLIGGMRALIIQAAHPLALAGVEQHSDYRSDPSQRLAGTARWLVVTTFGSAELAEREAARVRAMHRRVQGAVGAGRPYSAGDPALLRWVHLAFTDAFLAAQQAVGRDMRRFGPRWPDTYVDEWARSAEALGATDLPRSAAGLAEALDACIAAAKVPDYVGKAEFVANRTAARELSDTIKADPLAGAAAALAKASAALAAGFAGHTAHRLLLRLDGAGRVLELRRP